MKRAPNFEDGHLSGSKGQKKNVFELSKPSKFFTILGGKRECI